MTAAMSTSAVDLLHEARSGSILALSRLISALESGAPGIGEVRARLHKLAGRAHVIGLTGPPGSGKSTLGNALITEWRGLDRTVAVLAVDPSSSRSGGAVLGDRVRMQQHALDGGVFIRSMSSRGRLGGVSRATVDAVAALNAAGWDVVVVETVGAGQADLEIVQIAHTVAVVTVPGLGDDVQAIKAGQFEVADVLVVNKADRPGAQRVRADIRRMLKMEVSAAADGWKRPVVTVSGLEHTGISDLVDAFDAHAAWLRDTAAGAARERERAAARIRTIAADLLVERLNSTSTDLVDEVAERRLDPHVAAQALIAETHEP
jgi:LAO/AO transport system kinase